MHVWVAQLKPLTWYHRVGPDRTRTACGLPAGLYGYVIPVGEAFAFANQPCAACFTPPGRKR